MCCRLVIKLTLRTTRINMAEMSNSALRSGVVAILKGADLTQLSSKKVRKQLEAKCGMDLSDRKKDIDKMVMDFINKQESSQEEEDKRTRSESSASDSDFDEPNDTSPVRKKAKRESDADVASRLQDEENGRTRRTRGGVTNKPKKQTGKRKSTAGTGPKKANKYTEPLVLSSQLAAVMGEPRMKRSDVVKKMWAVIKERNLQDPRNKQFMICDSELLAIFGKKRVKPFGMMKYLKDHMFSADEVTNPPDVVANGDESDEDLLSDASSED